MAGQLDLQLIEPLEWLSDLESPFRRNSAERFDIRIVKISNQNVIQPDSAESTGCRQNNEKPLILQAGRRIERPSENSRATIIAQYLLPTGWQFNLSAFIADHHLPGASQSNSVNGTALNHCFYLL